MNIKRIFGAILTVLGISGLIYVTILFTNNGTSKLEYKTLITLTILSSIFFIAGISLVRTIKDEP
jgi:hypothetical protein